MAFNARTDLAVEAREMYFENSQIEAEIQGVEAEEEDFEYGICVTRVKITDKIGADALGKELGSYITIDIPENPRAEQGAYEAACQTCAKEQTGNDLSIVF